MKKLILLTVFFTVLAFSSITLSAGSSPVIKEIPTLKIIVDGKLLENTNTPINCNGRVLVGLRSLSTALGVQNDSEHIIWDKESKTIKIIKDSTEINLAIGDKKALVNSSEVEIDSEPIIYKNITYIPARFVSQSLSRIVFWDAYTNSVIISIEDMYNQVKTLGISDSSHKKSYTVNIDSYIEDGNTVFTEKTETRADPDKKLRHSTSTMEANGYTDIVEYFEDEKYSYRKPEFKEKWLKTLKSEVDEPKGPDSFGTPDSYNSFLAGMAITEKDSDRIVIEGESLYFAVGMTKGTSMDVLKDKTSKCSLRMEFSASSNELSKIDIKVTGNIKTAKGLKPYQLARSSTIEYEGFDSVDIPNNLNSSYSVPKGFTEYYNMEGYSLIVPKDWDLPSQIDKSPMILYINPKDQTKWCGIMPEVIVMGFGSEVLPIIAIRDKVANNMKTTLSGAKVLKNEKFKWKNLNAVRTTLSGTDKTTKKVSKIQVTVAEYLNTAIVFIYMGEEKTFNEKSAAAQKIIDSWDNPGKG